MEFDFSRNYFQLFGLEVSFQIDEGRLDSQYQSLQSQHHPDRFVEGDEQEKRIAMQATTFINEAYKILKEPQARARYMLELQDVVFDLEKDTTQDMNFLLEQMNLREQIDEVGAHDDAQTDPLDLLDELHRQAQKEKKQLIEEFENYFDHKNWDQAKEVVLKLQFYARLQQQINHKQEALEEQMM